MLPSRCQSHLACRGVDATPEKCLIHASPLIRCLKMTAIIHIVDVRYNNVKLTVTREWSVSKKKNFCRANLHNINSVLLPLETVIVIFIRQQPHMGPCLGGSLLGGSRCCSSPASSHSIPFSPASSQSISLHSEQENTDGEQEVKAKALNQTLRAVAAAYMFSCSILQLQEVSAEQANKLHCRQHRY